MKVKEAVGLLAYGTQYEIRGAYSGKIYARSDCNGKSKEKWFDRDVTDCPFYVSMKVNNDLGIGNWCKPIVGIWMHDYDLAKEK